MTKAKKKRKMTTAQKKAFVRRMKRARLAKSGGRRPTKRHHKKAVVRRKHHIKKEVTTMARRHHRKHHVGVTTHRRRTVHKHHGFGLGHHGGRASGDVMTHLKDAAIAVGGGIVAGMVANKIPLKQPLLKAISPALAGAALLMTVGKKNRMVAQMATGMMVMGGVAAIRAQFPNVPLLAGEEELVVSPQMLDYQPTDSVDYHGVEDFSDEMSGKVYLADDDENEVFVTANNI